MGDATEPSTAPPDRIHPEPYDKRNSQDGRGRSAYVSKIDKVSATANCSRDVKKNRLLLGFLALCVRVQVEVQRQRNGGQDGADARGEELHQRPQADGEVRQEELEDVVHLVQVLLTGNVVLEHCGIVDDGLLVAGLQLGALAGVNGETRLLPLELEHGDEFNGDGVDGEEPDGEALSNGRVEEAVFLVKRCGRGSQLLFV